MLGFCLVATCLKEWRPWEGERGWGGNSLISTTAYTLVAFETVPQRAEVGACCFFNAAMVYLPGGPIPILLL